MSPERGSDTGNTRAASERLCSSVAAQQHILLAVCGRSDNDVPDVLGISRLSLQSYVQKPYSQQFLYDNVNLYILSGSQFKHFV